MPTTSNMIGTTIELEVPQDIATTYDWVVDVDAPIKFIHTYGPVPGFKSYKLLDGDWKHEGARRRITLDDSSTATETIQTSQWPNYFDYELTDFKDAPLLTILLKRGYGQWWFERTQDGGTHVKWRYSFEPQSPLVIPLLWLFTNIVYRRFMKAAVQEMERFSKDEGLRLTKLSMQ